MSDIHQFTEPHQVTFSANTENGTQYLLGYCGVTELVFALPGRRDEALQFKTDAERDGLTFESL